MWETIEVQRPELQDTIRVTDAFRWVMHTVPTLVTEQSISELEFMRSSVDLEKYLRQNAVRYLAEEIGKNPNFNFFRDGKKEEWERNRYYIKRNPMVDLRRIYRSEHYVFTPEEFSEILCVFGQRLQMENAYGQHFGYVKVDRFKYADEQKELERYRKMKKARHRRMKNEKR
jgi:hypothetical protein